MKKISSTLTQIPNAGILKLTMKLNVKTNKVLDIHKDSIKYQVMSKSIEGRCFKSIYNKRDNVSSVFGFHFPWQMQFWWRKVA